MKCKSCKVVLTPRHKFYVLTGMRFGLFGKKSKVMKLRSDTIKKLVVCGTCYNKYHRKDSELNFKDFKDEQELKKWLILNELDEK